MNVQLKKTISIAAMAAGIIGMAAALYMDFSGSASTIRGPLLIAGALLVIAGVYLLPTRKHRSIINVLFLFPLIFAFAVTVLIPFACGIFYSMTDWNGIKFEKFVGLGNYISMFKSNDYIYSFVVTFIFPDWTGYRLYPLRYLPPPQNQYPPATYSRQSPAADSHLQAAARKPMYTPTASKHKKIIYMKILS